MFRRFAAGPLLEFGRPYGTCSVSSLKPSAEALGYFQSLLRSQLASLRIGVELNSFLNHYAPNRVLVLSSGCLPSSNSDKA